MHLFDDHGSELGVGDIVAYEGRLATIEAISAPAGNNRQGLVTILISGERRPLNILPSEIEASFRPAPDC